MLNKGPAKKIKGGGGGGLQWTEGGKCEDWSEILFAINERNKKQFKKLIHHNSVLLVIHQNINIFTLCWSQTFIIIAWHFLSYK